jgi:rhodanese-related sulfurtransferase
VAGVAPHPDRPFVEITSAQAKALFDNGAIFIDARRSAAYREGHVRGSRSISVWESDADEKVKAFYDEGHDAGAPIVVYCTGGDCEDSHELAQKLWGVTFDNVCVYRDGFPDWERRGWPVSRGDAP